jgi:hypothetical protein
VIGSHLADDRAEADGFTEELDPTRELGDLPPADEDAEA